MPNYQIEDDNLSLFQNHVSPTCVARLKVAPNMADPISLKENRLPLSLSADTLLKLVRHVPQKSLYGAEGVGLSISKNRIIIKMKLK